MNVMQHLQREWDRAALAAPDALPDPRPSWGNVVIAALGIGGTVVVAVLVLWAIAP